jgi:hypothetical protein
MYYRYVDDCFIVFKNKAECDEMFTAFNNLHPSIKFTSEMELENTLPFLDVLVQRHGNEFLTSVYRKKTFTGQYVNYDSFCSERRKVNLIGTLCDRALRICSNVHLDAEINKISEILKSNGYPERLIDKTIERRLTMASNAREPFIGPNLHMVALKLPFLGTRSQQMEKELKRDIRKCYNSVEARMIFTSTSNFTPAVKDHIPYVNKSMVVYQFNCHCENDYVGKTTRRLTDRMKEHVPRCVRRYLENPTGNYSDNTTLVNASLKSSVAKHLLKNHATCGREYDDKCFKILRCCSSDFELKVCEAVLILTLEPTLCIQREFDFTTALI